MPWLDLVKDPGVGNLNLRAIVAAIAGPRRVAHGQRHVRQLVPNQSVEIARNAGQNQEAVYVEVWLPTQAMAAGARVLFSSEAGIGETASLAIFASMVGGGIFPGHIVDRYRAVLLPNEQLYAQIIGNAAGGVPPARTPCVASLVVF